MHVPNMHRFVMAEVGEWAKSLLVKDSGYEVYYNKEEHSIWRNSYLVQFIAQDLNIQFV